VTQVVETPPQAGQGRVSATLRGDALSDASLMRAALDMPSEAD